MAEVMLVYPQQLDKPCEPLGMKRPDGEGTLENPVKSGAEGARHVNAESLRQKDGESKRITCSFLLQSRYVNSDSCYFYL